MASWNKTHKKQAIKSLVLESMATKKECEEAKEGEVRLSTQLCDLRNQVIDVKDEIELLTVRSSTHTDGRTQSAEQEEPSS